MLATLWALLTIVPLGSLGLAEAASILHEAHSESEDSAPKTDGKLSIQQPEISKPVNFVSLTVATDATGFKALSRKAKGQAAIRKEFGKSLALAEFKGAAEISKQVVQYPLRFMPVTADIQDKNEATTESASNQPHKINSSVGKLLLKAACSSDSIAEQTYDSDAHDYYAGGAIAMTPYFTSSAASDSVVIQEGTHQSRALPCPVSPGKIKRSLSEKQTAVRLHVAPAAKLDPKDCVFNLKSIKVPDQTCMRFQNSWSSRLPFHIIGTIAYSYGYYIDSCDFFLEDYDFLLPDFKKFFEDLRANINMPESWKDPGGRKNLEERIAHFNTETLVHAWEYEDVLLDAASRSSSPGVVAVLLASVLPVGKQVNTAGVFEAVKENTHFQEKGVAAPLLYLASLREPRSELNTNVSLDDWSREYENAVGTIVHSMDTPGPTACKSLSSKEDTEKLVMWLNAFDAPTLYSEVSSTSSSLIDPSWLSSDRTEGIKKLPGPVRRDDFQVFHRRRGYLEEAIANAQHWLFKKQPTFALWSFFQSPSAIQGIAEKIVLDADSQDVTYALRAATLRDGRLLVFSFRRRMWYLANEKESKAIPSFCAHSMMLSDAKDVLYVAETNK